MAAAGVTRGDGVTTGFAVDVGCGDGLGEGLGAAKTAPAPQNVSKAKLKSKRWFFIFFSSGSTKSSLVLNLMQEDDTDCVGF